MTQENEGELISRALYSNSSKQIILKAQREDALAGEFRKEQQDKYSRIYDQPDFKDLGEDLQARILGRKVNFQGKYISLNQLVDKDSASAVINPAILSRLIETENIQIGDAKAFSSMGYVPDYYIERTFNRQRVKTKIFKDKINSELFFITGANQKVLTGLGVEEKFIDTSGDRQKCSNGILLSLGQNDQEVFQMLCNHNFNMSVHWLMYHNGEMFYINSNKGSSISNDYIDKIDHQEITFSQPVPSQRVIIVASGSGTGKSTVLTSLANKMKARSAASWVVRVNLDDYAVAMENPHSLHNIKFQQDNVEEAVEFVSKMAIPGNPGDINVELQRNFFKAGLKKMVILFDGFDEISPYYTPKITNLIKALKESTLAQLWITTRIHLKDYLEKELQSPAYILTPFIEANQEAFLNRFWKWSLKFSRNPFNGEINEKTYEEIRKQIEDIQASLESPFTRLDKEYIENHKRISKTLQERQQGQATKRLKSLTEILDGLDFPGYAKELLNRWKTSIGEREKAFIDVPLNLEMLAMEIFEMKFQLPENLELLGLYDHFIGATLDINILCREKAKPTNIAVSHLIQTQTRSSHRALQELAVKHFFPEEELLPYLDEYTRFKEDYGEEIARIGVVTLQGDRVDFNHGSFAAYFLYKYLVRYLEHEQVQKLLLKKILIKEDCTLIRSFFNEYLEKHPFEDINLSDATIKSEDEWRKEKFSDSDIVSYQDTVLHTIVRENCVAIIKFLIYNGFFIWND